MHILASFRQGIFMRHGVVPASQSVARLSWLWLVIGAAGVVDTYGRVLA